MRGMVAGQPIVTQAQTKEFDEGHERIFGHDAKPQRGRWVYGQDGHARPVGEDWTPAETRARTATEEIVYGGAVATDGTPINSRKKHRDYLKSTGLAMASDFSKASMEKEARHKELKDDKARRETVERAFHKSTRR